MLKISAECHCGVLALFDIAYHAGGGLTQTKEIAARQRLSRGHIEQVFQRLKRAQLVKSQRGPTGGYSLAKATKEITIGDIIRAAGGRIELVACVAEGSQVRQSCERIHSCVAREVWKGASSALMESFDAVTLADLCETARAKGIERAMEVWLAYDI